MTQTLSEKEQIEATYKRFEKLIYHTCHRFKERFGGDVTEYISQANTIFIRAYHEWDEETSTVAESTHYRSWVHMSLLDIWRPIWSKSSKYGANIEPEYLEEIPEKRKEPFIDYEDMRHRLTKDGFTVLQLLLNAPPELQSIIEGKGGTPCNYRSSVKQYLKKTFGWKQPRVVAAFEDLGYELFGRPDKHKSATNTKSNRILKRQIARHGVSN